MAVTIGIDVGGTKIAAGVVDESGKVVARRQIATAAMHPTAVVAGIVKVAQELKAAAPGALGIGIGAAGLIDGENGVVLSAPNIAWENVPLRAMVADRIDLPVVIDNDANVAAWGEALYGAGKGYGGQHSQTLESMFCHIPGLYVVYPATPYDAKGMLKSAIRDNNPIM